MYSSNIGIKSNGIHGIHVIVIFFTACWFCYRTCFESGWRGNITNA